MIFWKTTYHTHKLASEREELQGTKSAALCTTLRCLFKARKISGPSSLTSQPLRTQYSISVPETTQTYPRCKLVKYIMLLIQNGSIFVETSNGERSRKTNVRSVCVQCNILGKTQRQKKPHQLNCCSSLFSMYCGYTTYYIHLHTLHYFPLK